VHQDLGTSHPPESLLLSDCQYIFSMVATMEAVSTREQRARGFATGKATFLVSRERTIGLFRPCCEDTAPGENGQRAIYRSSGEAIFDHPGAAIVSNVHC